MGFGGINAHVVLESLAEVRRADLSQHENALLASSQDAELFLLGGRNVDDLRRQVDDLLTCADRLSMAELTDLAAHLAGSLEDRAVRAAVVASRPAELAARLESLRTRLDCLTNGSGTLPGRCEYPPPNPPFVRGGKREGSSDLLPPLTKGGPGGVPQKCPTQSSSDFDHKDEGEGERGREGSLDIREGVFLGRGESRPRIGFLFPGQGSPATLDGGAWSRRFAAVAGLYERASLSVRGDPRSTAVAQPAIVTASLAALDRLGVLGIAAERAVGHSLGELTALHWAGAFGAGACLRLATTRGQAMAELAGDAGAMASLEADQAEVEALIDGEPVVIAGLNAPRQTVVSGPVGAVDAFLARAHQQGIATTRLAVAQAFHSFLVAQAAAPLARVLVGEPIARPRRSIVLTVTGAILAPDVDVRQLLLRQITSPVRFLEAMSGAAPGIDLWIEAGPGRVLSGLTAGWVPAPVIAMEAGGASFADCSGLSAPPSRWGHQSIPPLSSTGDGAVPLPGRGALVSSPIRASSPHYWMMRETG